MNHRFMSRFAAGAAFALAAAAGQAQVFSSSPFLGLPDASTTSATLDVSGGPASITDVNVILDITHTFCGDLDIILVPPSGDRYIHLTSDSGGAGDNFTYTRFDQASPVLISAGVAPAVAPFNGTFAPEGGDIAWTGDIPLPGFALAGLDDLIGTDSNGTWTLIIDDDAGLDVGTLNYFSLEFNGAVDPLGPALGVAPTAVGAANPNLVMNDGIEETVLTVTVTPGTVPDSTFNTTGSVTIDGSPLGLSTIVLLDNGVAPDQVAGDFIFSASTTVPAGWPGGAVGLPYTVVDDQGRTAGGNIALTVVTPPPGCPSGDATLSFDGVASNGPIGDFGNSIVTGDFGVSGQINSFTINGRLVAPVGYPYNTEARISVTAPSGNVYLIQPFTTGLGQSPRDLLDFVFTLPAAEDGTGTWTFEFYESYNDATNPDNVWQSICFAAGLVPTNPTGTGVATPAVVINDGTGFTDLFVTVSPGAAPTSTGIAVTVDGSPHGLGDLVLVDDGTFPDAAAGDNIFSVRVNVPAGTFASTAQLPFTITDAQSRTGGGNINLTVVDPPPACAPGLATLSFTGVQSNGGIGDGSNSVVSGSFSLPGNVNQITITGRYTSFPASYRSEARIRITAPDGTFVNVGPFTGAPATAGVHDVGGQVIQFPAVQSGSGTWTFEFFESFADTVNPDAIWDGVCFSADLVGTNPTATDTTTPGTVARDGLQSVTFRVTVAPGAQPTSTGLTVTADDSAIGGTGSLALLDNGVFPDEVAGDNIFTASATVPYNTPLGGNTIPYTVSDAQGRSFADSLAFTVVEANGACCTSSGCLVTTIGDCIDFQGGTFAGNGTACFSPLPMTTEGAGAFEDISATGALVADLAGDDDAVSNISLPFNFNFFGADYSSGNISTNGNFQFGTNNSAAFTNGLIPSVGVPNNALYVLWDDHDMDLSGTIYTETRGTQGVDQRFIIQWNIGQYNAGLAPLDSNTFQIVLFEDGSFEYRYLALGDEASGSSGATDTSTIGFEDVTGTIAVTVNETRASLIPQLPVSLRGNSTVQDTGVCGGSSCPACPADYDQDGGVTGADVAAFFADYEQGLPCGDTDQDGGITGADIATFFQFFEAGGC